jgi:uncharacterized protein (DUF58 family)
VKPESPGPLRRGPAGPELELESTDPLDARQFELAIKRLADSLNYGTDRSPFLGSGLEYVQSRPYVQGDPVKSIDWRVTARTRRVHVKEYETPKQIPVYLLIDTSASMTLSSGRRSKYAHAVFIAGGLALACLRRVSPVGVLGVGERTLRIEPNLSQGRILQWLHALRRYRVDESTRLGRRVNELAPRLGQRSVLFVLSDLHDPQALPALARLAQAHDLVALQLVDPIEEGLPGAGFLRAREAETGRGFVTRGSKRWVDPASTAAELTRRGVDNLTLHTDRPYAHLLRHFLESRHLLGRGAR